VRLGKEKENERYQGMCFRKLSKLGLTCEEVGKIRGVKGLGIGKNELEILLSFYQQFWRKSARKYRYAVIHFDALNY